MSIPTAIPVGFVACRSNSGRELLHYMREDLTRTVCGRYTLEEILPEHELTFTRTCRSCLQAIERKGHDPLP